MNRSIVFGTIAVVAAIEVLNFTGFCYREVRYLNDSELLYSAARVTFPSDRPLDSTGKEYSTILELLADNPDCCRVYRAGSSFDWMGIAPFWARALGYFRAEVELKYLIDGRAGSSGRYERYVYVSACGDVVGKTGVYLGT